MQPAADSAGRMGVAGAGQIFMALDGYNLFDDWFCVRDVLAGCRGWLFWCCFCGAIITETNLAGSFISHV